MATRHDIASDMKRDETLAANLSRIEKARASGNRRLVSLIDGMEATMTSRLGQDGYEQYLASAPLETLLRRYSASPDGKKAQADAAKSARPTAAGQASDLRPDGSDASVVAVSATEDDDDDESLDFRYSSDAEATLLDERRYAAPGRRREIDAELDAIHASRKAHLDAGETFDEFDAEEALAKHKMAASAVSDVPPYSGTATAPPPTPAQMPSPVGPAMSAAGHSDSDDDDEGYAPSPSDTSSTSVSSPSSGSVSTSGVPTAAAEPPDIATPSLPVLATDDDSDGDDTSDGDASPSRGSLAGESPAPSRGDLNEGGPSSSPSALSDQADEEQREQQKEKDKRRRRMVTRMVVRWLARLSPFIGVILVVALLASCVDQFLDYANPFNELFGGGGDSSSSTMSVNTESDASNASYAGVSNPTASGSGPSIITSSNMRNRNPLPSVYVDPSLAGLFSLDSEASGLRAAPPVDMPAFDDWFDKDDAYIADIVEKANRYDSDTDWMAAVDCDLCRCTWLVKSGGSWKAVGGYCTVQGATGVLNPDGSTTPAFAGQRGAHWRGPRACTAKGAFKVLEGKMENAGGTLYNTCMYPVYHMGDGAEACQCHRMHINYGVDPAGLPLSSRHASHGCTRFRNEVAEWIYRNIPSKTLVIVFDQLNPEPEVLDCDHPEEKGKADFDQGDWATWPGVTPLLSSSYDRTSACGRSQDAKSGQAGHVSGGGGGSQDASAGGDVLSDGTLSASQRAVISAAKSTPAAGPGRCLAWVNDVFDNAGLGFERLWTAGDACRRFCHSTNRADLKPGMILAVESTKTAPGVGHIGIYVGDGQVMDNQRVNGGGAVVTTPLDRWIQWFSADGTVRWGWAGNRSLA